MDSLGEHIGDGVYASFDGYHIWLKVQRGFDVESIALEPQVWEELQRYVQRLRDSQQTQTGGNAS